MSAALAETCIMPIADGPGERSFVRHPSELPIHIHCESQPCHGARHLHNVSRGGLACHSAEPLSVGAEVSVEIPLVNPPFRARGAVVWCRHAHSCYELGIQFIAHEDAFAARMVEQLCHIERYRREVREREGRILDSSQAAREWIERYAAQFPSMD